MTTEPNKVRGGLTVEDHVPYQTWDHDAPEAINDENGSVVLGLCLHEHAPCGIWVYAEAMLQLIEPIVPVAVKAFRDYVLESIR